MKVINDKDKIGLDYKNMFRIGFFKKPDKHIFVKNILAIFKDVIGIYRVFVLHIFIFQIMLRKRINTEKKGLKYE